MALSGLALFYGGLVRSKNILSVLMQCFAIAGIASPIGISANKANIFFIPASLQCVLVGFAGANTDHFL
jgi:ammonia channel protein AmtB